MPVGSDICLTIYERVPYAVQAEGGAKPIDAQTLYQ